MYIIADRLTATGLRIGGLKNMRVADENTVSEALSNVPDGEKVVVISTSLARVSEKQIARLRASGVIVSEIPDRNTKETDNISMLVKEAVGFDLDKK